MSLSEHLPHLDPRQKTNFLLSVAIVIVGTMIVVLLVVGTQMITRQMQVSPTQPEVPTVTGPTLASTSEPTLTNAQKLQILDRLANVHASGTASKTPSVSERMAALKKISTTTVATNTDSLLSTQQKRAVLQRLSNQ